MDVTATSILAQTDRQDFLFHLTFGSDIDPLSACIRSAYADFRRTLHGIATLPGRNLVVEQAHWEVRQRLDALRTDVSLPVSQDASDAWHRDACRRLIARFPSRGPKLHVGQAQKWLNMALKYVYTFGERRLPGFASRYPQCHVPLDSVLLNRLASYSLPRLSTSWSRLSDYNEYARFQRCIRQAFTIAPLDVEFLLWLGKPVPDRYVVPLGRRGIHGS